MKKFSFGGNQRLKSQKLIEKIFREGQSVSAFPLKLIYLKTESQDDAKIKAAVSVGKRHFKKAVDRNHIKRLLREAYRLNKSDNFNNISATYALMILYLGKDGTDFEQINSKMKQLLKKFFLKISDN